MNHNTAFQPPHLLGRWQYCTLNRRGGGPICGCATDEGHATREEAERHYYESTLAEMRQPHGWADDAEQRRCETCDEWTTCRVTVRVGHLHDDVHVLCAHHAEALIGENMPWRDAVRALVPFQPGAESYGSL